MTGLTSTARFAGSLLLVLVLQFAVTTPARASVIDLGTPLTGAGAAGELFELTVSFDLNGAAPNLVGQELYVDFSGLSAVSSSYQLGSVYAPHLANLISAEGDCATTGCNDPGGVVATSSRFQSFVAAFAPVTPTGPGTLFTLQFMSTGSPWSINLLGDDTFSMLTDQSATGGGFVDLMPFAIVASPATVSFGTAKIGVSVTSLTPPPTVVPEPASMLLFGTGLAAVARAARRRRRPEDDASQAAE
jgi:PEP-CTERM motif